MSEQAENPLFHKPLAGTIPKLSNASGSSEKQIPRVPNFLESRNQHGGQKPLLHGESQISVYNLKKSLEKNPGIRKAIAQKLGKKPYSREVDATIKEMESEIPKNITADGFISHGELKSMYGSNHPGLKEHWDEKHEIEKMSEGGITKAETWEFERRKTVKDFLRNLLGFGKK